MIINKKKIRVIFLEYRIVWRQIKSFEIYHDLIRKINDLTFIWFCLHLIFFNASHFFRHSCNDFFLNSVMYK